jgi:hypothetical protein
VNEPLPESGSGSGFVCGYGERLKGFAHCRRCGSRAMNWGVHCCELKMWKGLDLEQCGAELE